MDKGKYTCETLKAIRRQVAEANGIVYTPIECHFEGVCSGICPNCEREREYIEQQLSLKQKAGQVIKIVGLAAGLSALSPMSAAAEELSTPQDISFKSESFFFDFNGSYKPEHGDNVDNLVEDISKMPDEVFLVVGHTDARGSLSYNKKLSHKRADYIRSMILARFDDKQSCPIIIPVGAAYLSPNVPDAQDEQGHDFNRRTSLILLKECDYQGETKSLVESAVKEYMKELKKEGNKDELERVREALEEMKKRK